MTVFRTLTAILAATLITIGAAFAAQVDYFLKIEGVKGESTDSRHKGEIEILSWSWGETNVSSHEALKEGPGSIVLKTRGGKHSEQLARLHKEQTRLPAVQLVANERAETEYLTITLKNVQITSYQTGGSSGAVVPTEEISFSYQKIDFERRRQENKTETKKK